MCICLLNSNQILRLSVEQRQPPTNDNNSSQPTMTMHSAKRFLAIWFCEPNKRQQFSIWEFYIYLSCALSLTLDRSVFVSFLHELSLAMLGAVRPVIYIYVYARNIPKEPCHNRAQMTKITLDKTRDMCFLLELYNKFSINSENNQWAMFHLLQI